MQLYVLPHLHFLKLRFHLTAQKDCTLPSWKGSLLRGAFGHALRRTVCTMHKGQECKDCMLRSQCAYTRMFETFVTEPPPRFLNGQLSSPRPFIFEPLDYARDYKEGDTLWFDAILLGDATNFVPYLVFAIMQMGHTGLGARRHPFDLTAAYCLQFDENGSENGEWKLLYEGETQHLVYSPKASTLENNNTTPDLNHHLQLNFQTQTRLSFKNKLTIDFTFRMLVFKMLRRVLELTHFYMPGEKIEWEFHDLLVKASAIHITHNNLHWQDQQRYSNRHKMKMQMGGFIGDLTLEGDLSPFVDLLKYCELLHVGKGATFGLGKIKIETENKYT